MKRFRKFGYHIRKLKKSILPSLKVVQSGNILLSEHWKQFMSEDQKPKGFEKFWKKNENEQKETGEKGENKAKESKETNDKKEEKTEYSSKKESNENKNSSSSSFSDSLFSQNGKSPQFLDAIFLCGIGWLAYNYFKKVYKSPPLNRVEFFELAKKKLISKLVITKKANWETLYLVTAYNQQGSVVGVLPLTDLDQFLKDFEKIQSEAKIPSNELIPVEYGTQTKFKHNLILLIPLLYIALKLLRRQNPGLNNMANKVMNNKKTGSKGPFDNIFGFGKSRAGEYGGDKKIDVSFKDVAGLTGPKEEIQEFVEFLKKPDKFRKLGAKIPKGALLVGPPGTGKTLLAKACAGEAGVAFFSTSGSEFVEMFVGVGASRVRDLFAKAKEKSPAIIFIDEIDAVGKHRSKTSYNDERESTLNQLFVEMDGFGTDTNVVVFAATNRRDSLDKALIRAGRFDRQIEVNLPTLKEREDICGVHLRKILVAKSLDKADIAQKIAGLSTGMNGADLAAICNEAALIAARYNKNAVEMSDFYEAYDRLLTGLKRNLPMSEFDKKVTAFHEAGHAITGWFSKHAQPILKVSIVPRSKGSLGFTVFLPDEVELYTKDQLIAMLCTMYGGRAAEEVFIGTITTGAKNDLERATALAKQFIGAFGMSDELGNVCILEENSAFGSDRKMLTSPQLAKVFFPKN